MSTLDAMRIEVWWWLERKTGALWLVIARGRPSCWFDAVPAWAYRHRKEAERRKAVHSEVR